MPMKTLQKGSTGGSKRVRPLRESVAPLNDNQFASSIINNGCGSDTISQNVPHFLINLFRELELISSSDPLRKRLMQAFQEVYIQHCESNGSPNILPEMQVAASNIHVSK